jgi:hypothetical protein
MAVSGHVGVRKDVNFLPTVPTTWQKVKAEVKAHTREDLLTI